MNKWLLDLIICPDCKGKLKFTVTKLNKNVEENAEGNIICGGCNNIYPIQNGIITNWDDMEKIWHRII